MESFDESTIRAVFICSKASDIMAEDAFMKFLKAFDQQAVSASQELEGGCSWISELNWKSPHHT